MLTYHKTTEEEKEAITAWQYTGEYAIYNTAPYAEQKARGVGFANPGVIRFPFEKTAFFHQDSLLLRVNQTFPQTTEELKERAAGVHQNSVDWILKNDYNV